MIPVGMEALFQGAQYPRPDLARTPFMALLQACHGRLQAPGSELGLGIVVQGELDAFESEPDGVEN